MRIALKPSAAELHSPAFFISMYVGVVPPIILVAAIKFIGGYDGAVSQAIDRLITLFCLFSGSFIVYVFVRQRERRSEPLDSPPLTYLPTSILGWFYGIAFGTTVYGLEAIAWAILSAN